MHESIKNKIDELEIIRKLSQKYHDLELHEDRFITSLFDRCDQFAMKYYGCPGCYYLTLFFIDEETKKEIHVFKHWEFSFDKKKDCINNLVSRLEKLNVKQSIILNIVKEVYK